MIFKLAWRNIWRNKRRTYITAASILFAVLLASFMESLQKGAWSNMIGNVVNFYVGYAQVHQKGYWDDQSLDKAIPFTDTLKNLPKQVPQVKNVLPRIESFALASTGNTTKGVLVVGVQPDIENQMTQLKTRITKGTYFNADEQAALVAEGVADNLNLTVGDTIVLVSQGYHGVNSAGKYPVKGIIHFGSPELNKQMVYLPLKEAQWFFGAEGLITSLALQIERPGEVSKAVKAVKEQLNENAYEVMDWEELLPDLVQAKALDSAGNYIVYFILYLIIAFGIFGTILMMTKERSYEFGVLVAIGMRRLRLSATVWIEVVILGLLGAAAGILCSIPIVAYFHTHPIHFSGEYAAAMERYGFEPIFPALFNPQIFLAQAITVFIITAVLALYPLYKIGKLEPVEAMRD